MNADRRRILGPGDARLIVPKSDDTMDVDNTGIKKMFVKTGLISSASGSSFLEIEGSVIQVSVFGPRPIKGSFIEQASFSVDCKFLPHLEQPGFTELELVNPNGKHGLTLTEQKISNFIESTILPSLLLEKYPKSTIDLHITIIENSNLLLNLTNWIINASSLALIDAGIEIRDIVTSGQVKINNGQVIVDPRSKDEGEDYLASFMTLKNNEIVGMWFEGELSEEAVKQALDSCESMAKDIRHNINYYLVQQASQAKE